MINLAFPYPQALCPEPREKHPSSPLRSPGGTPGRFKGVGESRGGRGEIEIPPPTLGPAERRFQFRSTQQTRPPCRHRWQGAPMRPPSAHPSPQAANKNPLGWDNPHPVPLSEAPGRAHAPTQRPPQPAGGPPRKPKRPTKTPGLGQPASPAAPSAAPGHAHAPTQRPPPPAGGAPQAQAANKTPLGWDNPHPPPRPHRWQGGPNAPTQRPPPPAGGPHARPNRPTKTPRRSIRQSKKILPPRRVPYLNVP